MNINNLCLEMRKTHELIQSMGSVSDFSNGDFSATDRTRYLNLIERLIQQYEEFLSIFRNHVSRLDLELKVSKDNASYILNDLNREIEDFYDLARSLPDFAITYDFDFPNLSKGDEILRYIKESSFNRMNGVKNKNLIFDKIVYGPKLRTIFEDDLYGFKPDRWLSRSHDIKPIITAFDNNSKNVPKGVLDRLREAYASYVHGHWLSVIVLSRSVLEYSIYKCKDKFGIDIRKDENVKLSNLVDKVSCILPGLKNAMYEIVSNGNDVVHPVKKGNVEVLTMNHEEMAKDSIRNLIFVMESIYAYSADK